MSTAHCSECPHEDPPRVLVTVRFSFCPEADLVEQMEVFSEAIMESMKDMEGLVSAEYDMAGATHLGHGGISSTGFVSSVQLSHRDDNLDDEDT